MSDTMFYGVLRMPIDMAMGNEISRLQFYSRVQECANRCEAAEELVAAQIRKIGQLSLRIADVGIEKAHIQSHLEERTVERDHLRAKVAELTETNERLRNTIAGMQSAPAAAVVTIESREFRHLLLLHRADVLADGETRDAIIAHIDAHTAQAVAAEYRKGFSDGAKLVEDITAERDAARAQLARAQAPAPQQHAQDFPSLEDFTARIMPPKGYEDCRVISRNDQLVWLRDADVLPTDLVCFYDGDCRDVLTPYDNRVQPPMRLVQQHAQAALSDAQIQFIATEWFNDPDRDIAMDRQEAFAMGMQKARAIVATSQKPAAAPSAPAVQQMVIGFPDPEAVFAAFCDREGYPSDCPFDAALRKAFWEAVRMFSGDLPAAAPATHPQEEPDHLKFGGIATCPFCAYLGSVGKRLDTTAPCWSVQCGSCGAEGSVENTPEEAIRRWNIRAALASPAVQVAAVPEGWVLVPKEPNEELLKVIKSAMDPAVTSARHIWRMAMLQCEAAAPSPALPASGADSAQESILALAAQTAAARDVWAERMRQIQLEGMEARYDDNYKHDELRRAAAVYAYPKVAQHDTSIWPWAPSWMKFTNPRRDAVKAAALLIAEIERIDRALAAKPGEGK